MALEEQGRLDEAFSLFGRHAQLAFAPEPERTTAATPQSVPADTRLREALKHHQAGRFAEAEQLYRQVLAVRPDWAEVHVNLGMCLMLRGQLEQALSACQRGLELKPDYARGHCLAGDILAFQNRLEEAVTCY
jgi:tetratricopeptide (TPR) repeat protein